MSAQGICTISEASRRLLQALEASGSEQGFIRKPFANQLLITDIVKKAQNCKVFGSEFLRMDSSTVWKTLQLGACFICEGL